MSWNLPLTTRARSTGPRRLPLPAGVCPSGPHAPTPVRAARWRAQPLAGPPLLSASRRPSARSRGRRAAWRPIAAGVTAWAASARRRPRLAIPQATRAARWTIAAADRVSPSAAPFSRPAARSASCAVSTRIAARGLATSTPIGWATVEGSRPARRTTASPAPPRLATSAMLRATAARACAPRRATASNAASPPAAARSSANSARATASAAPECARPDPGRTGSFAVNQSASAAPRGRSARAPTDAARAKHARRQGGTLRVDARRRATLPAPGRVPGARSPATAAGAAATSAKGRSNAPPAVPQTARLARRRPTAAARIPSAFGWAVRSSAHSHCTESTRRRARS